MDFRKMNQKTKCIVTFLGIFSLALLSLMMYCLIGKGMSSSAQTDSVVYRPNGNVYPITSNNIEYKVDPKIAKNTNDDCNSFVWQYMWDNYKIGVPDAFFFGLAQSQKEFAAQRQETPTVGSIINFGDKGTWQAADGRHTAIPPGHVAMVTGVNSNGTITMMESGEGSWGTTYTRVKPLTDYGYFNFKDYRR
jgi:surface antigen